jgi:phospholipid/cholesterol/gamma-HCH transport system substrate-binding protein
MADSFERRSSGAKALTWTELRVGAVTLVSLVVLAGTILYVGAGGGTPLSPKYQLRALMTDVNGLKPGAPVRVGGVEVGTVTRVDFGGARSAGMVEVEMKIDRRVKDRVTTDSTATLGSLGLLGEKAVDITSSPRGTPIEEQGYVAAASEDPFKGLLSDASDSTAHLRRILSRMDAGEGLVGKALRDDELYNRMVDVSVRLQGVMGKFEAQTGPLGRLMNDRQLAESIATSLKGIETVVARLESGQGALGALAKDEQMSARMKNTVNRLDDVVGRLERGEGTAGRMLKDDALYQRLTDVSTRLDGVLTRLEKGEGSAGQLLQDEALYKNLSASLKDLQALIADVRKDPGKYLRVKVSLF